MIIDCISDTHGFFPKLEGGDLLIVAGDLTARDTKDELLGFHHWATKQNYRKTIIIAGNHDNTCLKGYPFYNRPWAVDGAVMPYNDLEYLCDSGTEFTYLDDRFPQEDEKFLPSGKTTLKIWGSPWTKTFAGMNPRCKAFTVDTEEELAYKFSSIPHDVDILITHSPPYEICDFVLRDMANLGICLESVGSKYLRGAIEYCFRPKLWVFGHVHEAYGQETFKETTICVNASHVNERYQPVNAPIRIIL